MHKAGARNSLIYLTGLETPDQQRLAEKEKRKTEKKTGWEGYIERKRKQKVGKHYKDQESILISGCLLFYFR